MEQANNHHLYLSFLIEGTSYTAHHNVRSMHIISHRFVSLCFLSLVLPSVGERDGRQSRGIIDITEYERRESIDQMTHSTCTSVYLDELMQFALKKQDDATLYSLTLSLRHEWHTQTHTQVRAIAV